MSMQAIYAHKTIGITDLKRGDTKFIDSLEEPIAILKRDSIKAYLIPEKLMKFFMDTLDEMKLNKLVNERLKELDTGKTTTIRVNVDDL